MRGLILTLDEFVEDKGDEEEDCENEKDGDDLMVNDEDLDEMYDMYADIQPVEVKSNNNKRKLSEEDTQTSFLTFDSLNSGETFVFCNYVSTQNKIKLLIKITQIIQITHPQKTDTEKKMIEK